MLNTIKKWYNKGPCEPSMIQKLFRSIIVYFEIEKVRGPCEAPQRNTARNTSYHAPNSFQCYLPAFYRRTMWVYDVWRACVHMRRDTQKHLPKHKTCTQILHKYFVTSLTCTFVGTFDLIIYTDKNAHVPKKWEESDPKYVVDSTEVGCVYAALITTIIWPECFSSVIVNYTCRWSYVHFPQKYTRSMRWSHTATQPTMMCREHV